MDPRTVLQSGPGTPRPDPRPGPRPQGVETTEAIPGLPRQREDRHTIPPAPLRRPSAAPNSRGGPLGPSPVLSADPPLSRPAPQTEPVRVAVGPRTGRFYRYRRHRRRRRQRTGPWDPCPRLIAEGARGTWPTPSGNPPSPASGGGPGSQAGGPRRYLSHSGRRRVMASSSGLLRAAAGLRASGAPGSPGLGLPDPGRPRSPGREPRGPRPGSLGLLHLFKFRFKDCRTLLQFMPLLPRASSTPTAPGNSFWSGARTVNRVGTRAGLSGHPGEGRAGSHLDTVQVITKVRGG